MTIFEKLLGEATDEQRDKHTNGGIQKRGSSNKVKKRNAQADDARKARMDWEKLINLDGANKAQGGSNVQCTVKYLLPTRES